MRMAKKHLEIIQNTGSTEYVSSSCIDKLYALAYEDIANGVESQLDATSNVQGWIRCSAAYEDAVRYLAGIDSGDIPRFQNLHIDVTNNNYYIRFEDSNARDFCVTNWGDGVGVTTNTLANVTLTDAVRTLFRNAMSIVKFNEFKYFTGFSNNANLTCLFTPANNNLTSSLEEITMPAVNLTYDAAYRDRSPFYRCTNLKRVNWNNCNLTTRFSSEGTLYYGLYLGCSSLDWYDGILPPGCTEISSSMFYDSGVTKIVVPEGVTYMHSLQSANACVYVELPTSMVKLHAQGWTRDMKPQYGGSGELVLACKATTPPTLTDTSGYHDSWTTIYVPDDCLSAYQTAWSDFPKCRGIYGFSSMPAEYKAMGTIE